MALALTVVGAIDAFALGSTGGVTALAILMTSYRGAKKYLDSGKLIDMIPESDTTSRELVTRTGVGDLTGMDGALVGTSTAGLLLLLSPKFRLIGAGTLLASFLAGKDRDNAKLIAVTSSAAAAVISNPVAAIGIGIQFVEAAANTTIHGISSAIQLSTTAIGLLVTLSGAVIGYVVLKD